MTDRRFGSSVALVTGHQDPDDPRCRVDWARLATSTDTLIVLMGVHRLEAIAAALIRYGRDPATPAAVVERGATPRQRTVTAPLAVIADAARAASVESPAVVVVGDVVRLRSRLRWFGAGAETGDEETALSPTEPAGTGG